MNATASTVSSFSHLEKDLGRHLCSVVILASRYEQHKFRLRSPGLHASLQMAETFLQGLRDDVRTLTSRILQLGGMPLCKLEEFEERSYLSRLPQLPLEPKDILRQELASEKRLQQMLSHTIRLAGRQNDEKTATVAKEVMNRSLQRCSSLSRLA